MDLLFSAPWLSVFPSSDSTGLTNGLSGNISENVTINTSGLAAGSYYTGHITFTEFRLHLPGICHLYNPVIFTVNLTVTPAPVNGTCGSANGVTYPYGSSSYSPNVQCSNGSPSNTSFPTTGNSVSWTCSGTNGGSASGTCSASQAVQQCSNGQAYVSGSCTSCSNGGCSGGGGNPINPGGGLICNNGGNNPPTCTFPAPTATLSASPSTIVTGQ